jgi:hypothetical protein
MSSHLANLFRQRRAELGIEEPALCRLAGYENVNKGLNRLRALEENGIVHPEVIRRFAGALGLDWSAVLVAAQQDVTELRTRWEQWADEPEEPCLYVRYANHGWGFVRRPVPATAKTEQELIAHAREVHRETGKLIDLHISRRLHVVIDEDGSMRYAPRTFDNDWGWKRSFLYELANPAAGTAKPPPTPPT